MAPAPLTDAREIFAKWKRGETLDPAEIKFAIEAETKGGVFKDELPARDALVQGKALDSPSYFATELVDKYYKDNFERIHYEAMDEVLAPFALGETVKIDGASHDPTQYIGLLLLFSRDTFKSSMLGILLLWYYLFMKYRHDEDVRAMYVHQVLKKAIRRGEGIRDVARHNKKFMRTFPQFKAPRGEWDTKEEWRWPCFGSHQAGEFSFTAYGETSDKTGGHYTFRAVDDWETQESVSNESMLAQSYANFQAMDPLKDRTRSWNPLIVAGTYYHYAGTYKQLEKGAGYLVWRVPAHRGSSKAIFDLCEHDPRNEREQRKIKAGIKRLERERAADLNFPKRLDWHELYMCARAQGGHVFNCQMMLEPVPEGEQRFDRAALDQSWVSELPGADEAYCYLRVDPAISKKKENDETAIQVALVDWRGWRYFVDGWAGREKRPTEQVRRGYVLADKWRAKGYRVVNIGVESVAYQEALAELFRNGIPRRDDYADGESVEMWKLPVPVRSIKRSSDMRKDERILEMDGPIGRREFKLWTRNPIGEKFLNQLKNFPHDLKDLLDAAHDMWEGVLVPPRNREAEIARGDRQVRELLEATLRDGDAAPRLTGTHSSVQLQGWN